MEKKKNKKKKKPVLLVLPLLILALLVLFALKFAGLLGSGFGLNDTNDSENDRNIPVEDITSEVTNVTSVSESEIISETSSFEKSVLIEVKQDVYYISGNIVSIDDIKDMISKDKPDEVRLENNYASSKAWEELKKVLNETDITVIEN